MQRGFMKKYRWILEDKCEVEMFPSEPHQDFVIKKSGKNEGMASLWNCGIVHYMPEIMRYCFEEGISLEQRKFLRDLPRFAGFGDGSNFDETDLNLRFQTPLRKNAGRVQSRDKNLIIDSSSDASSHWQVSFPPKDVPRFVEGILKLLDSKFTECAKIECTNVVKYYFFGLRKTYDYLLVCFSIKDFIAR